MNDWNGWERLWLVFAVLLGLPAAFLAYEPDHAFITVPVSQGERSLPQAQLDELFWRRARAAAQDEPCSTAPLKLDQDMGYVGGAFYVTCDYSLRYRLGQAVLYGIIPGGIIWVLGQMVAWVRRGFRQKKTP